LLFFERSSTKECCLHPTPPPAHCYDFLKTLYPGGIRTRAFCSWGGWDVDCATPPGQTTWISCSCNWVRGFLFAHVLNFNWVFFECFCRN
jgi:hypothetical protein